MLDRLLQEKKFPSPLIVEGARRTDILLKIARFALCESLDHCGKCRSCKQVEKGFHPDWISLTGNIKIEELREKLFRLKQKPFQANYSLFTYDNAQEANAFVQNALLKTLEEPLSHWVLIVGVNSKLSLLSTIRSRCLVYKTPENSTEIELSPEEELAFRSIEEAHELSVQKSLEPILKDRQKAKQVFQKLLLVSSQKNYPGHWAPLSPLLEEGLSELSRNLNPRLVWDRAWAKSFLSPL
jgi:DNA polymerase III delta prime subunit